MIKVSVIIPTYNRAEDLMNALDSLLEQDFNKSCFEVIVVDNNSSDNTEGLTRQFLDRHKGEMNVKYVQEKRQGDIYARHTGAAVADGDILAFTDDDATFDTNWVSEIARMFEENKGMGALGTNILIVWDKEPEAWVKHYERFLGKIKYDKEPFVLETGLFINNGALAITKNAFYEVGGNNPGQIGAYLVGDAEVGLCCKLHKAGIPIGFTNRTTMWHHQKADINGTRKDLMRRAQNNGISKAYTDIHFNNGGSRIKLLKSIIIQTMLIFKDNICKERIKSLNAQFQLKEDIARLSWLHKIQHDKKLIEMQSDRDWFLDEKFIPGTIIYQDTYGSI